VVGVGNRFRGDDAVGLCVTERLEGRVPPDVELIESNGDPVDLIAAWERARLSVVIDAVVTGGKPGTIYRFNGDHRLPAGFFRRSSHLLGLADAVELARTLNRLPGELVIVGVEAGTVEQGADMTTSVERSLGRVVDLVANLLESPSAEENGTIGVANA
jgi:hydrogenase maturation protease